MKQEEGGGYRGVFLIGAALAIIFGVHNGYGTQNPVSLSLLLASMLLVGAALFAPAVRTAAEIPVLLGAIAVELFYFPTGLFRLPLVVQGETELFSFFRPTVVAGFAAGLLWKLGGRIGWLIFAGLLLLSVMLGTWTIQHIPDPGIDVYIFQDTAAAALVNGDNPYSLTFPDIYHPRDSVYFYGEGVSVNGVLQFGFPYTPLPLFLALPGYLAGDVRYSTLAAFVGAALLMAFAWRGSGGKLLAVLFLFAPQFMHLLSMSWTEPYQVLLLAGVIVAAKRKSRLTPYLFGLMLVSKQYMVLLTPLMFLLLEKPWTWKQAGIFFGKALVTGCVVTLPLALWDFGAFWHSAVALQFRQPFRHDALSLLAWANPQSPAKWMWLPILASGAAVAGCLAMSRKRQVPFSLAAAATLMLFFALNKQAFANYYFLVFGALCCAIAESHFSDQAGESPLAGVGRSPQ